MELATPQAFHEDPELVWQFYNWRRDLISKVTFNPAHKAIVDLETTPHSGFMDFTLLGKAGEIVPGLLEDWP